MQDKRKDYPNFDSSWKVLTVWMTANDVMDHCDYDINGTDYLNNWVSKHDELLTNITTSTSNIYINLISTLDLSYIHRVQQTTPYCKNLHKYIINEGKCLDRKNTTEVQLDQLDHNIQVMNGELHKLAAKWYTKLEDQNRKDVAIQMQPF